jgi:hypothetical protein
LLRLAHEEWEVLAAVPKIRLEREPQGRIRWLEPAEESRLLAACGKSQNRALLAKHPLDAMGRDGKAPSATAHVILLGISAFYYDSG